MNKVKAFFMKKMRTTASFLMACLLKIKIVASCLNLTPLKNFQAKFVANSSLVWRQDKIGSHLQEMCQLYGRQQLYAIGELTKGEFFITASMSTVARQADKVATLIENQMMNLLGNKRNSC